MLLTGESLANRMQAEEPTEVMRNLVMRCPGGDHDASWTIYYWQARPAYYVIDCEVCDT